MRGCVCKVFEIFLRLGSLHPNRQQLLFRIRLPRPYEIRGDPLLLLAGRRRLYPVRTKSIEDFHPPRFGRDGPQVRLPVP